MPDLPKFKQFQTQTGTTAERLQAPLDPGAANVAGGAIGRGLQGLGAGIGDVGSSLFRIEMMNRDSLDNIAAAKSKQARDVADVEYNSKITNDGDTANWAGYRKEADDTFAETVAGLNWGRDSARAAAIDTIGGLREVSNKQVLLDVTARNNKDAITLTGLDLSNQFAADPEGVLPETKLSQDAYEAALSTKFSPEIIEAMVAEKRVEGFEDRRKIAAENIKPALIEVIEAGEKKDGIDLLNETTKQLTKEGVFTKAQAAETNKILGDWIDNYVAGRDQQKKTAEKLTTRQSYQDLMPALLDPAVAQQRFGMVDQSKLKPDDKKLWNTYIKGSYAAAPTANTSQGHIDSFGAAFDAMTLAATPQEAYDVVLNARFIDHSITDAQFNWAIDKIDNPYPDQLISDIRATYNANNEEFNTSGGAFGLLGLVGFEDKDKNTRVNESLVAWVDDLIKRDKVPAFDFKKKMYAQSSQFRVGNDRWYDIGQVIFRGGWEWEVVGFDGDGEPIVEQITR